MRRESEPSGRVLENINYPLIDAVLFVVGISLLLIMGYVKVSVLNGVLEALGTSFVVAAIVSFLVRRFYIRTKRPEIRIVAKERSSMRNKLKALKYSAREIDLLGIGLMGPLAEMAEDKENIMLRRVLFSGAKLRMMFLAQSASFLKQRLNEDGITEQRIKAYLGDSVRNCVKIFNVLKILYDEARKRNPSTLKSGYFEIRLINACPYITIYRCDDNLFWGPYLSQILPPDAPLFQADKKSSLFPMYNAHFEKLWTESTSGSGQKFLIRYYGAEEPILNEELVKIHLGEEWLK